MKFWRILKFWRNVKFWRNLKFEEIWSLKKFEVWRNLKFLSNLNFWRNLKKNWSFEDMIFWQKIIQKLVFLTKKITIFDKKWPFFWQNITIFDKNWQFFDKNWSLFDLNRQVFVLFFLQRLTIFCKFFFTNTLIWLGY